MACGVPLGEYIRNRRLTLAGAEVATDAKIIDVSLKYGYESPESFSRAFTPFRSSHPWPPAEARDSSNPSPVSPLNRFLKGAGTMEKWKDRGYSVRENAPIYYTRDMDATAKWFEEVLGWHASIEQRDEQGRGTYGCILPFPSEIKAMTMTPSTGSTCFSVSPPTRPWPLCRWTTWQTSGILC